MIFAEPLSDLPGIRHAFFTRRGGVSMGIHASLNCGPGSSDRPDRVARNRAIAMELLGRPAESLVTPAQVHGTRTITLTDPPDPATRPEGDGLATARAGIVLGVLAADCAPILLADPQARVIGAAHAGWKGALNGIIESVIAAMVALGAAPGRIRAAVGPCIARASYEVGPEFLDRFIAADPGNARFFARGNRPDHPHFDLPGFVAHRLRGAGVGSVAATGHDTCHEEDLFFSYRRATLLGEREYGRLLSAIVLTED